MIAAGARIACRGQKCFIIKTTLLKFHLSSYVPFFVLFAGVPANRCFKYLSIGFPRLAIVVLKGRVISQLVPA